MNRNIHESGSAVLSSESMVVLLVQTIFGYLTSTPADTFFKIAELVNEDVLVERGLQQTGKA